MTAIRDDDLAFIAPNIQIQVGTPPPFISTGIDPEMFPQDLFDIADIASRKTRPIGNDQTQDLIQITKRFPPLPLNFLIKNYGGSTTKPVAVPDDPSVPVLPDPDDPPAKTTKTPVPDLPKNLPFDEIAYAVKDVAKTDPTFGKALDPVQAKYFKNFPSAVYINAISSCISTPYVMPGPRRSYNGVINDSRSSTYATYRWELYLRKPDVAIPRPATQELREAVVKPRADGIIDVIAQSRNKKTPDFDLILDPGKWEKMNDIKNGDALNAFSLILGIQPGGEDNQAKEQPYSITITFGDVTFELFEDQEEATVSIRGMDPPEKRMIKPTAAAYLTEKFGVRPFYLTFIPVWNGILISDGIPGSSDWADSVQFIPKSRGVNINQEINNIVNPPQTGISLTPPPRPPKTIVQRDNGSGKYLKKYKAPGIRLTRGDKQIDFGKRLTLTYHRCGGAFKFVPIYFPQFSRYHLLGNGAVADDDLTSKGIQKRLNPNVFKVQSKSESIPMPIFSYESAQFIDFRTHLATIVTDKTKPWSCLSMEFETRNPDVRRPMQVFGAMIEGQATFETGVTQPPANADGVLSSSAISIPRIRSFNINKGLDGTSGDIVYDLFNPLTQQVDTRPLQEVGAIQVAITGGANTIPGVVFTGLAYGNSIDSSPGENLIRIPIKGRESKLSSEGGIALVNVPFFDGYDNRNAMLYFANYAGFPIDVSKAPEFRLISSYSIQSPILDFPIGTPVLQAMDQIATSANTVFYFNRFGTLIYMSQEETTGVNWNYPDVTVESFSDEPDHTWVRNMIIISALVADASDSNLINVDVTTLPTQAVIIRIPLTTYPTFDWAKMATYTIPFPVLNVEEVIRQAVQISKGQSRPRSVARCRIPGNSQIELLDTINTNWAVTSISHQVDTQRKTWSTELGVELIPLEVVQPIDIFFQPLSDLDI